MEEARKDIRPEVTFSSTSWRKQFARARFEASKALRFSMHALSLLIGLLEGLFWGDFVGERSASSSSRRGNNFRGDLSF